jgi:hypothetical protein
MYLMFVLLGVAVRMVLPEALTVACEGPWIPATSAHPPPGADVVAGPELPTAPYLDVLRRPSDSRG